MRFIKRDFRVDFSKLAPSRDFETSSRAVIKLNGATLILREGIAKHTLHFFKQNKVVNLGLDFSSQFFLQTSHRGLLVNLLTFAGPDFARNFFLPSRVTASGLRG